MAKNANSKSWALFSHGDGTRRSYPVVAGLLAMAALADAAATMSVGASVRAAAGVSLLDRSDTLVASATEGAAAPTGFIVPNVTAGLEVDTPIPSLPTPWTSNTAGYYYVKQGGSNGGTGFPTSPRGTIPNPIPAGAVVVLDNTAALAVSNPTFAFSGTSGSRCWFVSSGKVGYGTADAVATIDYTGNPPVNGNYYFFDGIDFDIGQSDYLSLNNCKHFMFRNCTFRGDGVQRAGNNAGVGMGGNSTTDRLSDGVFYNCTVRDLGLWNPSTPMGADIDVHGVSVGRFIERVWMLNSFFYQNQGDGIQITGGSPAENAVDDVREFYVQDCVFHSNLQNGWWHKLGYNLVFARNTVYNIVRQPNASASSAPSVGCGGQYDFNEVWYLFNRFYDNEGAIQFASASSGVAGQNVYFIGNVITNTKATVGIQVNSSFSPGTAIALWQGVNVYCLFNTISGFTGHGIATTPNSNMNLRLESNIIEGRSNASCYDIFMESPGPNQKIKHNSFPASPRFNINSSTTTTVAALQAADAANRFSNLSGAVSFVSQVTSGLGDYHVNAGDATIDAGEVISDVFATYLSTFGVDIKIAFDGDARPVATNDWDIGAFEQAA